MAKPLRRQAVILGLLSHSQYSRLRPTVANMPVASSVPLYTVCWRPLQLKDKPTSPLHHLEPSRLKNMWTYITFSGRGMPDLCVV